MATVSDVVVYGDLETARGEVEEVARRIARAQGAWQKRTDASAGGRLFNTFVLTGELRTVRLMGFAADLFADEYSIVETDHPDIVALDSEGCMTNKVMDFFHWERLEMCSMSAPTEICPNVWLGPTPDPAITFGPDGECLFKDMTFDVQIEASDLAQVPDSKTFRALEQFLDRRDSGEIADCELPILEFPSSGSIVAPTWSQGEVDGLMATCEWIYRQTHSLPPPKKRRDSKLSLSPSPERDADGDSAMKDAGRSSGRKILIHCTDGYTESSLLALAYYMYAHGVSCHDAWLDLHREKGRNFFAYGTDVTLLRAIQPRILQASPNYTGSVKDLCPPVPEWLERMDGSLPSRILPYMYLGNLGHANNPSLLRELGIHQILSVGEPVSWSNEVVETWPAESLLFVDRVQDNGVDPLTEEFGRCLEFIGTPLPFHDHSLLSLCEAVANNFVFLGTENGRKNGTATLVHCRVGVSRSATICIAEVMNELGLSFPRAYCFVRARRLNVIIQPHLRFS